MVCSVTSSLELGPFAGQHALSPRGDLQPLRFDDGFVLAQQQPDAEVLPLGDPLRLIGRRALARRT